MCGASPIARYVAAVLLAAAAAAGGCTKKMWVTHYPSFHTPQLKAIAVLEFRNESGYPGAGEIFTDELAAALRANGTYDVLAGRDLARALGRADEGPADADKLVAAGKLGQVQAVLAGTVTEYRPGSGLRVVRSPGLYGGMGYYRGYRGYLGYRRYYPYVYDDYAHFWNKADVAVTAELIRVRDRARLYATGVPLGVSVYSEGDPPERGRYGVLADATAAVVAKLIRRIALVPERVKVRPGKALRLARRRDGPEWQFTNDFRSDREQMFAVLSLPPAADRNAFRLTVVRKGSSRVLAERELVWSAGRAELALPFSPRQVAEAGGGPGHYRLRFHGKDKVVFSRKFEIK